MTNLTKTVAEMTSERIRSGALQTIEKMGPISIVGIAAAIAMSTNDIRAELIKMTKEGLITRTLNKYALPAHAAQSAKKKGGKGHYSVVELSSAYDSLDSLAALIGTPAPAVANKSFKLDVLDRLAALVADDIAAVLTETANDLKKLPELQCVSV